MERYRRKLHKAYNVASKVAHAGIKVVEQATKFGRLLVKKSVKLGRHVYKFVNSPEFQKAINRANDYALNRAK